MGRLTDEKDKLYKALAHPCRRQIICMLREEGSMSTGEISKRFDMAEPSVSRHLSVLENAGFIYEERKGRNRIYAYCYSTSMEIMFCIEELLCGMEE